MDRSDLLELEEGMKVYDSSYETKRVEPGCVIDIFIELASPENSLKGQVLYVCKEGETKTDVPAGIAGFITYDIYNKYFKDCLKDQTIEIGSAAITVNEIYENVNEYANRFEKDIEVGIGSVVDATHNGHNKFYYIVEPNDGIKVQKGLDVIDTNAPLAINLLSKKAGDVVKYNIDVEKPNEVVVNRVYKSINDFNKKKGINLVKEGSIVEVKLDKIPFVFRMISTNDETPDLAGIENVDINTPLGIELAGKTEGDYFTFMVAGKEVSGYIYKTHDSLDEYQEFYNDNPTKILG
ncbi:MAG: GreA/GreB family elongation factor [Bacilli bacterium]|nr:GreA/GreB family elongation factor [Bacilli bacterium]